MSLLSYIGLVGGLCSLAGYVPLGLAFIRGQGQPERASWLIWTLSSSLVLLSSWAIGARTTIWVPVAYLLGSLFMTILAFVLGKDGWGRLEKFALLVAIISSIRWVYFNDPFFTLAVTMAVGFLGYIPNIERLMHDRSKTRGADVETWTLFFMGSIFNLIAVSPWTPDIATVPIALFVMNGIVFGLTLRNSIRREREDAENAENAEDAEQ